jgi:hypothetical protein
MALGAYSIIRYSDHLSDQRVNLGVLVWHPLDGFKYRFSPGLDRVHSVDPRVALTPIKKQMDAIVSELKGDAAGKETLTELSRCFKEGLEVAAPYPAQIQSAEEMIDHLYQALVSPVPEIRRASTQLQFERRAYSAVFQIAKAHRVKCEEIGRKKLGHLTVNVGLRTIGDDRKTLWRALSLQAHDHPDRQLAFAKATAMDISVVKGSELYRSYHHFVTLQGPKAAALAGLADSKAWLESVADKVFVVETADALPKIVEKALSK